MRLSKHFTKKECEKSGTAERLGIDNSIPSHLIKHAKELLENVIEPVREYFDTPFSFNSFFRCIRLNTRIGGSSTSDHCKCMAADFEINGIHNIELGIFIYENCPFKQLIFEHVGAGARDGWIHVSHQNGNNKGQVLQAMRNSEGKTCYKELTEEEIYKLRELV